MARLYDTGIFSVNSSAGSIGVGYKLYFYTTGTSTLKATYPTRADVVAGTNANPNPMVAAADGRWNPIWLTGGDYKVVLKDFDDVTLETRDPGDSNNEENMAFSHATSYPAGTVGKKLQRIIDVDDKPYSADPTGSSDSYAGFAAAIAALPAAGGIISARGAAYRLETEPTWGTKNIIWDIGPDTVFSGAGTGTGKFPYMETNGAQMAVGPFIQSRTTQKSAHANGGVAAFNVEMLQPDAYGAGQSVAIYAGAKSNNANASGNSWAINALISVGSAALGTHQCIEVDVDCESTSALVKGISISGGGAANPDKALEITRLAGTWAQGITIGSSQDALVNSPIAGSRGIVLHGVGTTVAAIADTALSARQYADTEDTILLQRHTDTTPTGNFLRAVNAANSSSLATLTVAGDLTLAGGITVAQISTAAALGDYANDAAAAAGGVALRQFYRNGSVLMQRVV